MATIPRKFLKTINKKRYAAINYNKIAKTLKGKVNYKIDLRKTDTNSKIKRGNNAFNFGERMALLKSAKAYRNFATTGVFHPVNRSRGESKTAFKKRLRNTLEDYGQEKSGFKGVWNDVPKDAKTKFTRYKDEYGRITTKMKFRSVNTAGTIVNELYIPIELYTFNEDPARYIEDIFNSYEFDVIYPVHGGFRGNGVGHTKHDMWRLINRLIRWANKYKLDSEYLTGFLLQTWGD